MNKLIATATLIGMALASMATLVPKGTDVRLAFDSALTSKTAKVGDKVKFHVVDDVLVDGQVVIKKGTEASGMIDELQRGRRFGVNASIRIRLDPIAATDGTMVPIATKHKGKKTGSGTDKAAIASGAGALVLGPIGLGIGYFITGKEVKVKSGDTLTTEVTSPTDVKVSVPASAQDSGKGAGRP